MAPETVLAADFWAPLVARRDNRLALPRLSPVRVVQVVRRSLAGEPRPSRLRELRTIVTPRTRARRLLRRLTR